MKAASGRGIVRVAGIGTDGKVAYRRMAAPVPCAERAADAEYAEAVAAGGGYAEIEGIVCTICGGGHYTTECIDYSPESDARASEQESGADIPF